MDLQTVIKYLTNMGLEKFFFFFLTNQNVLEYFVLFNLLNVQHNIWERLHDHTQAILIWFVTWYQTFFPLSCIVNKLSPTFVDPILLVNAWLEKLISGKLFMECYEGFIYSGMVLHKGGSCHHVQGIQVI